MQPLVTTRRKWLRRAALGAMLLLVGAVVNVAVAWGCVIWSPREEIESPFGKLVLDGYPADVRDELRAFALRQDPHALDEFIRLDDSGRTPSFGYHWHCVGLGYGDVTVSFYEASPRTSLLPLGKARVFILIWAGWPEKAVRAVGEAEPDASGALAVDIQGGMTVHVPPWIQGQSGSSSLPDYFGRRRSTNIVVPYWVEPRGFAVNTVFYAALSGLFVWFTRAAREAWRWWHARCTGCGYPRSGLPRKAPCPECGHTQGS